MNESVVNILAYFSSCSVGSFSFTYLGFLVGESMAQVKDGMC